MPAWEPADLGYLRYHWGDAYAIHRADGAWIAERRDTRETLRAEDPEDLLNLIRADYSARPVSRIVPPSAPHQATTQPQLCPDL